jgi:hypothetical protein
VPNSTAKVAIDTFFVRFGDTVSAIVVGVGIHQLGLDGRQLATVNVVLVGVWIAIATVIARGHRRLTHEPVSNAALPAGAIA